MTTKIKCKLSLRLTVFRSCNAPVTTLQQSMYWCLLLLRSTLILYCSSLKWAKTSLYFAFCLLLPIWSILTTWLTFSYREILREEPKCYSDNRAWTITLCLAIGWFLVYIYTLLGCGLWYKRFRSTGKGQQLL